MGWKPIKRSTWHIENGSVSVPESKIAANAHALYSRRPMSKPEDIRGLINHKEEILNHIFNVTFGIAGDDIISKLFCEPLVIQDSGPFVSLGREIKKRYGLADNITQQDALFVTDRSVIGVELKLDSKSSADQIMKYVALMNFEEARANQPMHLGLMFIVPQKAVRAHWRSVGLEFAFDRLNVSRSARSVLAKQESR